MNAIDMDAEQLYVAVEPARTAGKLEAMEVTRCRRGCFVVGTYKAPGGGCIHITRPLKLSAAKSEELSLPSRTPGRAWMGGQHRTEWVGCPHLLREVELP